MGLGLCSGMFMIAVGCDSNSVEVASSGSGTGGEDCWYCGDGGSNAGSGGATSGKGSSSSGKGGGSAGGVMLEFSGQLNTDTGAGTYAVIYTADDDTVVCDASYTITGATIDASCTTCTFAYEMPLSMPMVTVATGCGGVDQLTSTKWGHKDPSTVMFEKNGGYSPIDSGGTSTVEGNNWTFTFEYYLAGGDGKDGGGKDGGGK